MSKRKNFDDIQIGLEGNRDISVEEGARRIFNLRADEDYDARVVANPIAIDQIWADVRQPRRAIPASVRLHWNGNPEDVPELLKQWRAIACEQAGIAINVQDVLEGRGDGIDTEDAPAVFVEYISLLRLAGDIRQLGLRNPISVVEQSGRYLIETGERRWLAYHALNMYTGDSAWSKIPATRSDGTDFVWKQATENTKRRDLNAISMARQLALLIMDTRTGIDGMQYDDYENLVVAGGSDRRYYAQVANGNVHRIPKGMGERIQSAMSLSEKRLADYRSLLRLTEDDAVNDALWIRADVEDWPDIAMREIRTLPLGKVREIVLAGDDWTLEDLRALRERPSAAPAPAPAQSPPPPPPSGGEKPVTFSKGDFVRTRAGHDGEVISASGLFVHVQTVNGTRAYHPDDLMLVRRAGAAPAESPPVREFEWPVEIGEAVQVDHTGEMGECIARYISRDGQPMVIVQIEGDDHNYAVNEITGIGQSWEDFIRDELENDDVTFDEDEDFPSPAPPHSVGRGESENPWQIGDRVCLTDAPRMAGIIRYIKGEKCGVFLDHSHTTHYYDWQLLSPAPPANTGADNRQYPPSDGAAGAGESAGIHPRDRVVIDRGSAHYQLLSYIASISVLVGDETTIQVAHEIQNMTLEEARRLAGAGKLKNVLDAYYDHVTAAAARWLDENFTAVLQHIERTGDGDES